MTKITTKNVFENIKYLNILRILEAYDKGLEFQHLAYILIGEKKLRGEGYISNINAIAIKNYLERNKTKEYILIKSDDVIRNPQRLAECLIRLINLKFIEYDKVNEKYKLNPIVKIISTVKDDVDMLSYYQDFSRMIEIEQNIISDFDMMNIYASLEFVKEYNNSQQIKEKVDQITKKIKNLLNELSELGFEAHKNWHKKIVEDLHAIQSESEEKLREKFENEKAIIQILKYRNKPKTQKIIRDAINEEKNLMNVKPHITLVMHAPGIHSGDYRFNAPKPMINSAGKLLVNGVYYNL